MKRFLFLVGLAITALFKNLRARIARPIAINAALTPLETSHGTETLMPDAAIAFPDAIVKKGSTDRNFAVVSAQVDIPYGVLVNDSVNTDEPGFVSKAIALFGLWPESLRVPASGNGGNIATGDRIVVDPSVPGKAMKMPATSGQTYLVIGRARFAVTVANGEPISLIHQVPHPVTNP